MNEKVKHIDINDEQTLVQECIEDNRLYQEAFYRKFAPTMYEVCKNYTNDRDEAMDFLQNGFISVFKNLHKFRFEGSLEGWVRRIVIYRIIDTLRKEKKHSDFVSENYEEPIVDAEEFELENVNTSAARIRNLVNELPEKAALVLKLYAIEGYTHAEISEILNVSIGTSKSQLNRARKLLKEALQK